MNPDLVAVITGAGRVAILAVFIAVIIELGPFSVHEVHCSDCTGVSARPVILPRARLLLITNVRVQESSSLANYTLLT